MFQIKNRTICVLGAKRSAKALCELIARHGGIPKVSDAGKDPAVIDWVKEKKLKWEVGAHSPEFVLSSDLIVLSPGVPFQADILEQARSKGIPILGEVEFSFQFCQKPVIAITGSNGKTTVSTLIHQTLQKAGHHSSLGGNIGNPFALCCDDRGIDYFVLEISSFQSESITQDGSTAFHGLNKTFTSFKGFKPFAALILNFSDNHLDRHSDIDDYFRAKTRLLINMGTRQHVLLSARYPRLVELAKTLSSPVVFFDKDGASSAFGPDNPNYLAIHALARILGITKEKVQEVLKDFKGVEHRLEWVRTLEGVDYINDSKSTTAEAGRWAMNNTAKPIILICGGKDKNIDFAPLRPLAAQKVRKMIIFGEAKSKLAGVFCGAIDVVLAKDLQDAVIQARQFAREGECVILSPMCASFDMFKDYEERGRIYKSIVRGLN